MRTISWLLAISMVLELSGCALEEVRNKHRLGSEWRHSGSRSTDDERYSVEEGLEFRWEKGWTTGLTFRRRDVNEGAGDEDNGLWVDVSFPLWKAPKKPDPTAQRVAELEKRIAALEGQEQAQPADQGD